MHLLHFSVPLLLIAGKALLPTVNYINKLFRPLKHQKAFQSLQNANPKWFPRAECKYEMRFGYPSSIQVINFLHIISKLLISFQRYNAYACHV
jgi:hypothetical protein